MARKLNSTAALVSAPTMDRSEYHSKSVRALSGGGFIVSECHEADGNYKSTEYFTRNPDSAMGMKDKGSVGQENLAGAIQECNK